MKPSAVGKVVAACFALAAFAVGVISGLAGDNPAAQILLRSLLSMAVCYPIGYVTGMICDRVVNEQIEKHRKANPVPHVMGGDAADDSRATERKADDEDVIVV